MQNKLQQGFRVVLGSIPVLTGLTFAATPSIAATFSRASGDAFLYGFSHDPLSVATLTDTDTFTLATGGFVEAEATADAFFETENPLFDEQIPLPFAGNSSLAEAFGVGQEYVGIAKSEAAVIGWNFFVGKGETFSFDFLSAMELETYVDNPRGETAIAEGNISFFLFDESTQSVIDFFSVYGLLKTARNDDIFAMDSGDGFTVLEESYGDSLGGNQEFINAAYLGEFSRYFDEDTYLTLVEVKTSYAMVKAPEPSSFVALFVFGATVGALKKRK